MRAKEFLAIGILVAIALVACTRKDGSAPETTVFLNHDPAVKYVGVDACRKCHVERASTAAHTGMGRAFYRLTPDNVVEDFTSRNTFVDPGTGLNYRMTRREGQFLMKQYLLDDRGREVHADEREMVYVIGSGNHSRSYVTVEDGRLWQMPVCWYPGGVWDLCPGFDRHNGNFGRKISDSCVFCHNGRMEVTGEQVNRFVEPLPMGIDCERCHGPGELHVAKWGTGEAQPTGETDPTIVNPRRLPPGLRIQVCFQCHLGDSKATERANRFGKTREDFRPGQSILEAFVPIAYMASTRHDFGLSAQGERLMLSACFTKSGGRLECLTCHDPHVTVFRADRPTDFFRSKCLSCHLESACTATAAARAATTPRDDCVRCHMRKGWADDQKHADFTDHWIRRSIADDSPDRRASLNVVALLPAEFRKLSPAERSYAMGRGMFGLSGDHPSGPDKNSLLQGAESAVRSGIAQGFDHAEAFLVLGKAQVALGRRDAAVASLREALERDPASRDAAFELAKALGAAGARDEAVTILGGILTRRPDDAPVLAELGRIHFDSGRPEEALRYLDRAAAQAPFDGRYEANRAIALQQLGRLDDARSAAADAVRRDPDNIEVWQAYGDVHRAAGDTAAVNEARARIEDLSRRIHLYGNEEGASMTME